MFLCQFSIVLPYCRYFQKPEDAGDADVDGCADAFYWWHKKLADFFEGVDNVDRLVEVRVLMTTELGNLLISRLQKIGRLTLTER